MKSYWRQPYQFFNEVASAIKARTMLEPLWFKTTSKYPTVHQGLHMRIELREIEFLEDKYRHLYLKQFPLERQYSPLLPRSQQEYKTPMDKFFARFNELISQGVSPDTAYEKCLEEKVNSVELENLELHYFKQQAGMIYADPKEDEIISKEPYMSPYYKARSLIDRRDYMKLVQFVQERKESGITKRIHRQEIKFATNDDIIRYISAHPEDAYLFGDMKIIPSSRNFGAFIKFLKPHLSKRMKEEEIKTIEQGSKTEEELNDENLISVSGENVDKTKGTSETKEEMESDGDELSEMTSIEEHIGNIRGLIEDITQEYGIDLNSNTLYDSLDHTTRIKVLNEYLIHVPEEISLKKPFYKDQTVDEYEELSEKIHDTTEKAKKSITSKKLERLFENYRKLK